MALSTSPDIARLIADTEAEILRVVSSTDPATAGVYEMCRYHLGLDGSGPSGKRMRPLLGLLAYASIAGDYRRALPGAAAVELGHNFSLVHDDIEDGDRERRHRPALWSRYGVPQAINAGDLLFSLSRVALHRLTDLGFPTRRSSGWSASMTRPASRCARASTSTSGCPTTTTPCRSTSIST
jgi:geranylgeranyl diphosphate synthase type I